MGQQHKRNKRNKRNKRKPTPVLRPSKALGIRAGPVPLETTCFTSVRLSGPLEGKLIDYRPVAIVIRVLAGVWGYVLCCLNAHAMPELPSRFKSLFDGFEGKIPEWYSRASVRLSGALEAMLTYGLATVHAIAYSQSAYSQISHALPVLGNNSAWHVLGRQDQAAYRYAGKLRQCQHRPNYTAHTDHCNHRTVDTPSASIPCNHPCHPLARMIKMGIRARARVRPYHIRACGRISKGYRARASLA